jgi:hypothetical protein
MTSESMLREWIAEIVAQIAAEADPEKRAALTERERTLGGLLPPIVVTLHIANER